jgi:HSP20 family protein
LVNSLFADFDSSLGGRRGGLFGNSVLGGGDRAMWPALMSGERDFLEDMPLAPFGGREIAPLMQATQMDVDVEELPDKYLIVASAPGYKKEDLSVNVDNGVMTIEGRHREEHREEDPNRKFLRVERKLGHIRRALVLPEGVDPQKVKAKYEAGTLKVEIPKSDQQHVTSGNIKVEGESIGEQQSSSQPIAPSS